MQSPSARPPRVDKNSRQYKLGAIKVSLIALALGLLGGSCLAYRIKIAEENQATSTQEQEQPQETPRSPRAE